MAMEELGAVIDVHGGGSDLVFPHHEAELLQAERLTGQGPFARIWAHAGMVGLDGEKMSKSLGNLVFVRDLLGPASPPGWSGGCSSPTTTAATGTSTTSSSRAPTPRTSGG